MASARERLEHARLSLTAGFLSGAVSSAYYAMLYAARAALSEEELYAKTHSATWSVFNETFVVSGRFDADLASAGQQVQRLREAADYDARVIAQEEADAILVQAEQFVAAIASMLGA